MIDDSYSVFVSAVVAVLLAAAAVEPAVAGSAAAVEAGSNTEPVRASATCAVSSLPATPYQQFNTTYGT